ncbi:NAD(P)-binding protein [Neurospora crassa]|uniref:NAD(P)-binding protein n=2 Tax=Neurospora crassa TaxID=5141 RepID=Q7SF48_NEUCR|nr:hypothetical protein NCU09262 [Neurospora crassa OR74A]EAA35461.1 hypothetical protein NCU09262 [Neurospora crassa OR74A]KHE80848.1 NAD(P)-binding protein [Neurospora crassa]CAE76313.1 conserved hypothetical protein [Neurospora crassa]|eukprot:XP_964697.1 hypothetical protein NCU09262 [Neurospora crassa OR74A]
MTTAAAADSKTIVLITGATRGIGFETAKHLSTSPDQNYHIILCGRRPSSVESAITILRSLPNLHASTTFEFLNLDLTSDTSTISAAAAAAHIAAKHGHLDTLVHSAAISSSFLHTNVTDPRAPERVRENWHSILDTNLIGPALLTDALLPLLSASQKPERKIIFVSSGLGSIPYTFNNDGDDDEGAVNSRSSLVDLDNVTSKYTEYSASKAALNMYAKHLAWRLENSKEGKTLGDTKGGQEKNKKWKVNVVCPGYTSKTAGGLDSFRGKQEPWEAAETVVRVVQEQGEKTGTFRDKEGEVPW